ncbi:MAG: hypothetical protein ABH950_03710 [Candidatus Altiarchaeota archaeon]
MVELFKGDILLSKKAQTVLPLYAPPNRTEEINGWKQRLGRFLVKQGRPLKPDEEKIADVTRYVLLQCRIHPEKEPSLVLREVIDKVKSYQLHPSGISSDNTESAIKSIAEVLVEGEDKAQKLSDLMIEKLSVGRNRLGLRENFLKLLENPGDNATRFLKDMRITDFQNLVKLLEVIKDATPGQVKEQYKPLVHDLNSVYFPRLDHGDDRKLSGFLESIKTQPRRS